MTSWGKLAIIFSLALTGARGQDDDDDTTLQYPTAFDQDSVGNSGNESALCAPTTADNHVPTFGTLSQRQGSLLTGRPRTGSATASFVRRAVAAISFDNKLYVAINTQKSLDGANVGDDDTTDIVIRSFDIDDLDEEAGAQFGGDMDDTVRDIARNSDQYYVVIVGSTESETEHLFDLDTPTGAMDWFIASLDPDDFELISAYVNGTTFDNQEATAVAIASDGSVIVAGWTWGEYFEENAGTDNSGAVGYDAWVLKISVDLEDLGTLTEDDYDWSIQFGTVAYDTPQKIVLDSDDNIYVIGTTADNSDVLTDDEEGEVQAMFVYKLDPDDGDTVWSATTELGFLSDGSAAYGAVLSEDESELYISGNTRGIIGNFSGSTTDSDELFLVSLDVDSGDINWVWQSESNATVFGTGGVVLAEDGSPIVGGVAFGNQFNLSYEYWEFGSGDMIAAKIDTDLLEVVKYFTATAASNETREQPWAMVKDDNEDDGVFLIGYEDGDFEDEDVEPDDNDLNYLVLKVELEELPEEEEEDGDDDYDFPYWYVGVPVFAVGILAFVCAYKCAESSQRALQKKATMI